MTHQPIETLFIVGCPRSGTTWVQMLLAQHPHIATAPETQIFTYYLDHFRRQWRHEHEGPGSKFQGNAGLSRLLTDAEFDDLCRRAARIVLDRILAANPEARLIVEKSPRHAEQADFIHRLFPDARFLHVIRDPRDAASSLMAASRDWGRGWAPRNAIRAARLWNANVNGARRLIGRTDRYRELRYEHLLQEPVPQLGALLEWLGLQIPDGFCERAVEACSFNRLRARNPIANQFPLPGARTPTSFFRRGTTGHWRDELARSQIKVIEYICAEGMHALGYRQVHVMKRRPIRIGLYDSLQRINAALQWRLQRLAEYI